VIKNIKYLISLLLIFSLTVNEGILYSQSSSINYYQTSEIFQSNGLVSYARTYIFGEYYCYKNLLVFNIHSFVKQQIYFRQQIQLILKLQTDINFKIDNFISSYINLYKNTTSKGTYSSLYIG